MTVKGMSAVLGRRGTWARLAEARPHPEPTYSQPELRERRRQGYTVRLGGDWSLTDEVAAICTPMAEKISDAPHSVRFLRAQAIDPLAGQPMAAGASIDDLADAVHGVIFVVVGMLREDEASRQMKHLTAEQRTRARVLISTLAERPPLPEFDRADAHSGAWVPPLVDMCAPYAAPLADLLERAATWAVSDRLVAALREVDHAVRALEQRLALDAVIRADRDARTVPTISEADRARAELESLGVSL